MYTKLDVASAAYKVADAMRDAAANNRQLARDFPNHADYYNGRADAFEIAADVVALEVR